MKNQFRSLGVVTLGLVITMVAYKLFLNVYMISVGGITGLCVLAEAHLYIPYTVSLIALNAGLFIWGMKVKGLSYVARSCAAMVVLGLLLDIPMQIPVELQTRSRLVAMVAGSILSGVGYAMIVSQDTSTGGSDLLGMIVTKKFPYLSTGVVMTGLDLIVIIASGFLEGTQNFLFSLAAMALCNATLDIVVYLIRKAEMPIWMQVVKRHYMILRKRIVYTKVTVNPYALALECCVFFIIIHRVLLVVASYGAIVA